jgi:hypothetical protein
MSEERIILAEGYKRANCCKPEPNDPISGYYSYNNEMIVHKSDCLNLQKVEEARRIKLKWADILDDEPAAPDEDFYELDELDFKILNHHKIYGVDYSLKVAGVLHADKKSVFESHSRLREMNLLERVKKLIIQYRKGIVDNKWIKHRNHTYYELTEKGKLYLEYHQQNKN